MNTVKTVAHSLLMALFGFPAITNAAGTQGQIKGEFNFTPQDLKRVNAYLKSVHMPEYTDDAKKTLYKLGKNGDSWELQHKLFTTANAINRQQIDMKFERERERKYWAAFAIIKLATFAIGFYSISPKIKMIKPSISSEFLLTLYGIFGTLQSLVSFPPKLPQAVNVSTPDHHGNVIVTFPELSDVFKNYAASKNTGSSGRIILECCNKERKPWWKIF